jgi:hypothetical protein
MLRELERVELELAAKVREVRELERARAELRDRADWLDRRELVRLDLVRAACELVREERARGTGRELEAGAFARLASSVDAYEQGTQAGPTWKDAVRSMLEGCSPSELEVLRARFGVEVEAVAETYGATLPEGSSVP